MCLIVAKNGVRKDKIKYIYKVFSFDSTNNLLVGYHCENYVYKAGYNYPKGKIDGKFSGIIGRGVLHAYTSINKLNYNYFDEVGIRIPVRMEDILYYGTHGDVGLKKLFIPKGLYERVVSGCKPNTITSCYLRIYW